MHPKQLYFSAQGSVPFGYVPTTFLLRGPSPTGTSRLLFPAPCNPPGKMPRTLQTRRATCPAPRKSIGGPSPSGTSRLLFYSGIRPLQVRPDYFSAQGSVLFGYVLTTFLLKGPSPSGTSRLLFPAPCNPLGKTPRTLQTRRAKRPAPRKSIG
ncbi:hypothetical protein CRG98_015105 [Punica granatum]|uniref:Uncharacterized protein n=1 Tax=Punica granatum TaxID=22663 RepID=A0A2I0K7M9_PUNGR|nr:hypothetical protein CRG98_015105 [Punica granatum]